MDLGLVIGSVLFVIVLVCLCGWGSVAFKRVGAHKSNAYASVLRSLGVGLFVAGFFAIPSILLVEDLADVELKIILVAPAAAIILGTIAMIRGITLSSD